MVETMGLQKVASRAGTKVAEKADYWAERKDERKAACSVVKWGD